jgi:hypothetical protein
VIFAGFTEWEFWRRGGLPEKGWGGGAGYRVGKFGRGGTDDELEKPLNPI